MKKNKIALALILAISVISAQSLFGEEENESPVSMYLQVNAAYYPKSECITGDTHFAPITGPYSGLEGSITYGADYKINTPLGDNWLVSGANVVLGGALEATPISVKPNVSVEFTPLPFLVFKAGASVGWGWNIGAIEGLCVLNEKSKDYESISTFDHPYYDFWGSGTFQFDTGAIFPGDWTHVVTLATYTVKYSGIAGLDSDAIYEWQCSKNKARGLVYEAQCVLGYQMPLPLKLAGVMVKADGHFNGADYGKFNEKYNGAFTTVAISPVMQFQIGAKDSIFCLFDFSSRRSFDGKYTRDGESLYLKNTGREWYFQRFALSWTHTLK